MVDFKFGILADNCYIFNILQKNLKGYIIKVSKSKKKVNNNK